MLLFESVVAVGIAEEVAVDDCVRRLRVHRDHWYTVPAEPNPDNWNNPLKHLRAVAKPEDYVLFKLDIDNNPVAVGDCSG